MTFRNMELMKELCIFCLALATVCGQMQQFRRRPVDAAVIQGQMVELQCEIDNRRGRVQWTKDGFLLGFDREIPGYLRYKMVGREDMGEYNLQIKDVRLEDDGEYQCQVMPSDGQRALNSKARLSVLVPPLMPTINGEMDGAEVSVQHTQLNINLTCVSSGGKPAANIRWERKGRPLGDNIIYYTEEQPDKKFDAISILTLTPKSEDDLADYACITSNPAMELDLRTKVVLRVLHPPGEPEITGYDPSSHVKMDESLTLKCVSRGGNPPANLHWFKNGEGMDYSYTSSGRVVVNEYVFTVSPKDNNAVLECRASNRVTEKPLVSSIKLKVLFSPSEVEITGKTNAKDGDTVNLTCTTSISNPPATITWYSRAQEIEGINLSWESPRGGFISQSTISVQVTEREDKNTYTCFATNQELGRVVDKSVVLRVLYPPGDPVIAGYTSGAEVQAGSILRLTCISVGGNPLATITWWKGDTEKESSRIVTGNQVKNVLEFILAADDNTAEYRCNASNEATYTPKLATVSLQVNFAPAKVTVTTSPAVVRSGQKVEIICKSSTSNPESVVTFWKDGTKIAGINGGVVPAEYGGKSTIQKLILTPHPEDNGQIYACNAANSLIKKAVSDAVTLNVLYKPQFDPGTPKVFKVKEGEGGIFNMSVTGNPPNITFKWYKAADRIVFGKIAKRDIRMPHFVTDYGALNISKAIKADAGGYTVVAENTEGSTSFQFNLDVLYKPEIKSVAMETEVLEHKDVKLVCTIDANPLEAGHITWVRQDYNFARTVKNFAGNTATLVVKNATRNDIGEFFCHVNNTIKEVAEKKVVLIVKFPAQVDRSRVFDKAAAAPDRGQSGQLKCQAKGAPAVEITWQLNGNRIVTTDPNATLIKYNVDSKKISHVTYESVLTVFNVTKKDYGDYDCLASNALGRTARQIKLDGTSRPEPPYDIKAVNSTHDSVTIKWTAGFDGGSKQEFRVRYNLVGEKVYSYKDVSPQDATVFTVIGLMSMKQYEFTVRGKNSLGEGAYQEETLRVSTHAKPLAISSEPDEVPLIIILTVCIIGMIMLGLNVLLILFLIRRRQRRFRMKESMSSQSNTVEMVSAPTVTEDSRSYSTYEKRSIDDYSDDYRGYGDDDDMRRFLPSRQTELYGNMSPPLYSNTGPAYSGGPPGSYSYNTLPRDGYGMPPAEEDDYAEQLRRTQMMGTIYDAASRGLSKSEGKLPPPIPTRASSRGPGDPYDQPPIPSRNYDEDDIPRYVPAPGSYSSLKRPPQMQGHLV